MPKRTNFVLDRESVASPAMVEADLRDAMQPTWWLPERPLSTTVCINIRYNGRD